METKGLTHAIRIVTLCLTGIFFFAIPQHSSAQINVPPAYYMGTGMSLDKVTTATATTDDKFADITSSTDKLRNEFKNASRVMLYNVGKDMFLNAGGRWGVRTSTFTEGLTLILYKSSSSNYYDIRGPFKNSVNNGSGGRGSFLGFVNNGTDNNGVYFDRTNRNYEINSNGKSDYTKPCNHKWVFELVSNNNGDCTYRIKILDTTNGTGTDEYYLCANQQMTVFVFQGGNYNLVKAIKKSEISDFENNKDIQWKIVSMDQLKAEFIKTNTLESDVAANATFLMRAQNFNRSNIYNDQYDTYGVGWQISKVSGSSLEYTTGYEKEGYNYADANAIISALDPRLAMFHCAAIKKAKKGDRLFQKVTLPLSGWYSIECQGLYNDEGGKAACAALYANADVSGSKRTPYYDFISLRPKSYGDNKFSELSFNEETFNGIVDKDGTAFLAKDLGDGKVTNKVEAGIAFYAEKYPNRVMIYADTDNKELEVGIEITEDMDETDGLAYFDDFKIRYHGESFALNEEWDDFVVRNESANDHEISYENRVMVFKRDMEFGKWNSLCMPVNLTKSQLQEAFSANVMLARLAEEPVEEGTIEFVIADLDNADDDDIVLRRGECVLIKPTNERVVSGGAPITIKDVNGSTIEQPYFVIPRVSLKKSDVMNDNTNKDVFDIIGEGNTKKFDAITYSGENTYAHKEYPVKGAAYAECKLNLCSTFENQRVNKEFLVPAGSFTFYKGSVYHLPQNYSQKGYSWWIEDRHGTGTDQIVANHRLSFSMSGISDNTTFIEGITSDITERDRPQAVYNLQGQVVRRGTTSLEGLPHGIYVVKGKKIMK